jgi:hypothetical protein
MTCEERLKLEQPEKFESGFWGCPSDHGYLPDPYGCNMLCSECWDREIKTKEGQT